MHRGNGRGVVRFSATALAVCALVIAMANVSSAVPSGAAAHPAASPGDSGAAGDITKINHVVVLMQENRSYDSYFGQLHFEGQPQSAAEPRNASNPNPLDEDAPPIRAFDQNSYCEVADLNHSWTGTHQEINGDDMNGFTAANAVA